MNSDKNGKGTTTQRTSGSGGGGGTAPHSNNSTSTSSTTKPGKGGGKDKKDDTEDDDSDRNNKPNSNSDEDNALVNSMARHPYLQLLDSVQDLLQLLTNILDTVTNVYRGIREDILHHWDGLDQDNATEQQRQRNRRAVVVLLNLLRYFSPRRFSAGMDQWDFTEKDNPHGVVRRLVSTLDHVVGYTVTEGAPLVSELCPMMDRVVQRGLVDLTQHSTLSQDPLWVDLNDYHGRVVAFVREVINPALLMANVTNVTNGTTADVHHNPTTSDTPSSGRSSNGPQAKHQPKSKDQP